MKHSFPSLTTQQTAILLLLLRFRYLSTLHIQILLHHKHKSKITHWLNHLTDNHYIQRFYTQQFPRKPAYYCLIKGSIPYIKEQKVPENIIKRIYEYKKVTQTFHTHCLFLVDIYLSLLQLTQTTQATLYWYTKIDLYGMAHLIRPHPDAYIAIEEKNNTIQRYFLDVFDPLPPRMILKKRVQQYVNYFAEGYWQNNTDKPFPKILYVLPDEKSKRYIAKHIKELSDDSLSFYLSTWDAIRTHGLCKEVLEKVLVE